VRKWMKVSAVSAFMAAGMVVLGSGPAQADITTSGDGSVLSGNQVVAELNAPINVCGNAVAVLGALAGANCENAHASVGNGDNGNGDNGHDNGNGDNGDYDDNGGKDDYYYYHH
jgi:hypothetical protein